MVSVLAVQYFTFFWGGSHWAKAKGYSTGMVAYGIFWPMQILILPILAFALPDKYAAPLNSVERHHHDTSHVARIIRYRRNALVYNILGIAGVLLALLIILRPGLFHTHISLAIYGYWIFGAGYLAIICGCWWWVRAKNWTDLVLWISLSPLAPLLLVRSPNLAMHYVNQRIVPWMAMESGIAPLLMMFMPFVMIGVVAVLPDKSGLASRKSQNDK